MMGQFDSLYNQYHYYLNRLSHQIIICPCSLSSVVIWVFPWFNFLGCLSNDLSFQKLFLRAFLNLILFFYLIVDCKALPLFGREQLALCKAGPNNHKLKHLFLKILASCILHLLLRYCLHMISKYNQVLVISIDLFDHDVPALHHFEIG